MNIAILTGGESAEREVALRSAANVRRALVPWATVETFVFPEELEAFLSGRREFACVVPVFHGRGGEDGTVQGFLRTLGMPFVFSDVAAQAAAMDKTIAKMIVSEAGLATPAWEVVERGRPVTLPLPFVVKPLNEGSSIGVSVVRREDELLAAMLGPADRLLVERYVAGREFTVAVVERGGVEALPVIEIRPKTSFFDYVAKYDAALCEEICPAWIEPVLAARLQSIACRVHELIGARDVSRSDFIVDASGKPWFIEVNTIPGMTGESLLPKAVAAAGLNLGALLMGWVRSRLA